MNDDYLRDLRAEWPATDLHVASRLRAWAKGSLPCMAAVEFIVHSVPLRDDSVFIGHDDHPNNSITYLDVFVEDDEWEGKLAGLSSGEKATWNTARSLVEGELYRTFWSLDRERQTALLNALTDNR